MIRTAFITGITGQDGSYLSKFLLGKKYRVFGLVKKGSSTENLKYLKIHGRVKLYPGDICDSRNLSRIIKEVKPREIYNFAAHSFVADSWQNVKAINEINYFGVINLLEVIRKINPKIRFYQASTSEMFGQSNKQGLLTEETPFHPLSPYAISKLAAYEIVNNYRDSYRLFAANGICFNHESPLRDPKFVTRKISLGVAKIKLGLINKIELGNLDSVRDWGFAGDYVRAMWLMLQQQKPDNFIISTGENHTVKDALGAAFNYVGIKDWEQYVRINKNIRRPVELKRLVGSNKKAKRILKWEPKVKFRQLIEMMVEADLARLSRGQPLSNSPLTRREGNLPSPPSPGEVGVPRKSRSDFKGVPEGRDKGRGRTIGR